LVHWLENRISLIVNRSQCDNQRFERRVQRVGSKCSDEHISCADACLGRNSALIPNARFEFFLQPSSSAKDTAAAAKKQSATTTHSIFGQYFFFQNDWLQNSHSAEAFGILAYSIGINVVLYVVVFSFFAAMS
jgi:hypothetical protein